MEIKINKICSRCNKDFELKQVEHNGMLRASVANFENCPHCGERNDHWIKVDWPEPTAKDKQLVELQSRLETAERVVEVVEDNIDDVQNAIMACFGKHPIDCGGVIVNTSKYNNLVEKFNGLKTVVLKALTQHRDSTSRGEKDDG